MTKSKIVAFVAALALFGASTASAAYMFNMNLGFGMRNNDVKELQLRLNQEVGTTLPGTTYFGGLTQAAAKQYQTMKGITPVSGYVGPLTRAALNGSTPSGNFPAGCTSASGYSSTTGQPCNTGSNTGNLPAGCTSTIGYSPTTGLPCTGGSNNNNTQTGPVSAMVASTNPASGVIVIGQATANLAQFTFTGSGTVNSITLKRSGISDQNTLSNVYLYDGAARLSDGYSFNSNGEIMMNNLGLTVSGSRTISVMADVSSSATSGQTIAVALTSFTAGTTANTVTLSGNTMSVASGSTLASASFNAANTASGTSVQAGSTSFEFWAQTVQVNTRTLWLKGANFRMVGSAPSDAISNINLYVDGINTGKTATVTTITGSNYAVFDFISAPVQLTTGSHSLSLRGNVDKGSSRTVQFSVQQAADLMIMDPQVGVNVAVSTSGAGTMPSSGGSVTISTGTVTASNDSTFNAMSNITGGSSNTVIGKYKVRAYGEDVKVTSLSVLPVLASMTPSASGLQNVTVYFNGSQVGTQTASWTSGAIVLNLGSQMIIPAGRDSTVEVRADLRTTAGTNYTAGTVSANLVIGSSNAQGQSSYSSISTPAVTGHTVSVQTGTLALSKNPGYASQNLNPNTTGAKIGSFVLQNQSTSESIRVTNLSLSLAYGAGTSSSNLSALRTSETSGNASTPVQPATAAASASGVNTFSTDFTIAPGAVKTLDIYADSSSDAGSTATVIPTLTVTSIGSTSNVSATSSATAGQTIAFRTGVLNTPTIVGSSSTAAQLIAAASGGSADGSKAVYNFTSASADSVVTELTFTVSGATTATYVKVGSVSAPVVSGTAYLTGLSINVPQGGSGTNVDVFVSYPEVGTSGLASNTTSALTLTTAKYTSGNTTATLSSLTVAAPTMTLVGSKPVLSVTSANVSGLNLGGETKIGEVTVTADAKGNIKLNDIKFAVSNVGFTTNPTFTLARLADGSTTIAGTSCGQGTAAAATQTIFCEFGTVGNTFTTTTGVADVEVNTDFDGYTIPAGTSKTFSLYATVSAANTGTNLASINTSLVPAGFNWDDTASAGFVADASTASPSAGTNLTGSSIYNFPTNSYTVHQ